MIGKIINRVKKEWRKTPFGRIKKNANPLRWGVIGLGYMAETFSCAIDGSKDDVVHAVASRSLGKAKAFAKNHGGCKAFGSYEEMVYDENLKLDVIYIATPVKYHFENVRLCLEAGKNVLCEKPITSTLEQFEQLQQIAKRNNCFFMEGMWMKCLPSFQKACDWIKEGKIGNMELVRVDFYKREHIREGYAIYNAQEGGGILKDFGVYAVAFIEHFLGGLPDHINHVMRKSSHGIDADWQIRAQKGNVLAVVNLSSNFGSLSKAEVVGSKGIIEWDSQFNRTNHIKLYNADGEMVDSFSANYQHEGFEYEVKEVHDCVKQHRKESAIASLISTHNTMELIDNLMKQ